jgi:hypothetical protein
MVVPVVQQEYHPVTLTLGQDEFPGSSETGEVTVCSPDLPENDPQGLAGQFIRAVSKGKSDHRLDEPSPTLRDFTEAHPLLLESGLV